MGGCESKLMLISNNRNKFGIPFFITIPSKLSYSQLYSIIFNGISRCSDIKQEEPDLFKLKTDLYSANTLSPDSIIEISSDTELVALFTEENKIKLFGKDDDAFLKIVRDGTLESLPKEKVVDIYSCFDEFIKSERLGKEDAWYCPKCKEHREASKKLDLFKLPDILVIHLKRFSHSRYHRDKIENFVSEKYTNLD